MTDRHVEAVAHEQLRKEQWPTMTTEQKVEALDAKLSYEIERIYNHEFPLIDEEIHKFSVSANEVGVTARSKYDQTVQEVRVAHRDIELTKAALEQAIQSKLAETINQLIARSSSETVAAALLVALKSTVLKTRPATREELKAGENVLVTRPASQLELKAETYSKKA